MLIPQFTTDPTLINLQSLYLTNLSSFPPGSEGTVFLQSHMQAAVAFRAWDDAQGQMSGYPPCSWGPYWSQILSLPEVKYFNGSFYLFLLGPVPIDLGTILPPLPTSISTLNSSFAWITQEQLGVLIKTGIHEWLFKAIDKYLTSSGLSNDGGVLLAVNDRVRSTWFYEVCRCYYEMMRQKHFATWDLSSDKCPPPPPPSGLFTVSPNAVLGMSAVTLSWTTANATSASIDQGIGVVPLTGSKIVTVTASTTFTLMLTGSGGTKSLSATVTVSPPPPPFPTGTFSAKPPTVTSNSDDVLLEWTSNHATSAEIDNGIGAVALNGTHTVNLSSTTTYRLTLIGLGGTVLLDVTIQMVPKTIIKDAVDSLNQKDLVQDIPPNKPAFFDSIPFNPFAAIAFPAAGAEEAEALQGEGRRGKRTFIPKRDRPVIGKPERKKKGPK